MLRRRLVLALGIAGACSFARADAGAEDRLDRPVYVTVVGHGFIRFRLSAGVVAPCDSLDDRMLFDGSLAPGRYAFSTGAWSVCYQHTSGALREVDWSTARIQPTVLGDKYGHRCPARIVVLTD
jgi:hypothetical protein